MMAEAQFLRFGDLPTELRLQIWDYALSTEPALLGMTHATALAGRPMLTVDNSNVARVCGESREVVSKTHRRIEFSANANHLRPSAIWVNVPNTFFYFGRPVHIEYWTDILRQAGCLTHVRSIAFHLMSRQEIPGLPHDLSAFPKLENVIYILNIGLPLPPVIANKDDLRRLAVFVFSKNSVKEQSQIGTKRKDMPNILVTVSRSV